MVHVEAPQYSAQKQGCARSLGRNNEESGLGDQEWIKKIGFDIRPRSHDCHVFPDNSSNRLPAGMGDNENAWTSATRFRRAGTAVV